MSSVSIDDVLKLAALSKLSISIEEAERYKQEIESILHFVEKLQKLDTEGLEPTYQVTSLENVMRVDEVINYGTNRDSLLSNCKNIEKHMFKVNRMVG